MDLSSSYSSLIPHPSSLTPSLIPYFMIRIEDVIARVSETRPHADTELIRRAYLFSALHHRGQTRASGEPYLVHPLEVAAILADMRLDEVSVSTGLLHDVVEDTLVDLETIRSYFGDEI